MTMVQFIFPFCCLGKWKMTRRMLLLIVLKAFSGIHFLSWALYIHIPSQKIKSEYLRMRLYNLLKLDYPYKVNI